MQIFARLRRPFATAAIAAAAAKTKPSRQSVATRNKTGPKPDPNRITGASLSAIRNNPELDKARAKLTSKMFIKAEKKSRTERKPKAVRQAAATGTDSDALTPKRKRLMPVVFRRKTAAELLKAQKRLEAKTLKENDPELQEAIAEAETYALTVDNIRFDFYRHFDDEVYGNFVAKLIS